MRIGFIGLGNMGGPMALNVLRAGHTMAVLDVRPELAKPHLAAGARWADTPKAVAEASDVVFTSLPGPAEVEAVALGPDGIIEGLRPGGVYVDLSTNSPTLLREAHRRFAERGCSVMDAPLGGRSPLAWTRQLLVMVGGDRETFERCRPLFEAIGDRVLYCGPIGSGMICKLVHNAVNAVFRQATGECFTLGVKAGVDAEVLWDVVRKGITCTGSEIEKTMRDTWLRGRFDTGTGSLDSHYKDTALVAQLGRELGVPMALTEATLARLTEAKDRGWGRRDSTASLLLQEERAGVAVRIPETPAG